MANSISSSGITNGSKIVAAHITQITDALSKASAYDIKISGSLVVTGSTDVVGTLTATSMSAEGSGITGIISSSYAVTSSHSLTGISASYATSASHATSGTGSFAGSLSGTLNGTGYITLTQVSESLNYASDTLAGAGGVPLGGLYRSGSFIKIRMS